MMAALAYIAWRAGDALVAGLALATLGASVGFFVWNYPRGLIFLGDSGATCSASPRSSWGSR